MVNPALQSIALLKAARHWTRVSGRRQPARIRWWESPTIVQHVNERICGVPLAELGAATAVCLNQRFPGRIFDKAISVGCGSGFKEMMLVQSGLVEEFHLFELSKARVDQAREQAQRLGIADKIVFHNRNGFDARDPDSFDLVHWNNALHHMLDVEQAIAWSRRILRDGGVFFMDDYVGPTRMQWSRRTLAMASRVRRALPARALRNPYHPTWSLPRKVRRPIQLRMYLADPTECADSGRILASLGKSFPHVEIIPTGGVVFDLALRDVLHNLDETADREVLAQLLRIDDLCTRAGEYHYAVAVASKITR